MAICPHCSLEIQCNDIYCPWCKKRIQSYFSISVFLKENFHLFTIIGVIGTMIALLPNLGEKLIGPDWILGGNGVFLVSAILFGCLFLFGVYAITIRKIFVDCRNEETDHKIWIVTIKKGDKFRLLLILALTFMLFPFLYYIILSAISIPDFYPKLTVLIIFFLLMLAWTGYLFYDIIMKMWDDIKKDRLGEVVSIILIVIGILCIYPSFVPQNPYPINPNNVAIHSNPEYYSPSISSDKGIKLTTTNTSYPDFNLAIYHWKTNYGYFIDIKKPYNYITILGNETYWSNSIYWSYPSSDIEKEKPSVKITLDIFDNYNQTFITNSTMNLTWLNNEIIQG
jgi:hypothetical protein